MPRPTRRNPRTSRPAALVGVALVTVVSFVAFVSACSSDDDSGRATTTELGAGPVTAPTATDPAGSGPGVADPPDASGGVEPEGFTTVNAVVTDVDGTVCELCLWLADTPDERGRGLMGVTDLGDADGMAFRFDSPTSSAFYMFRTPTPLSIAWFAPDGEFAATADMAPCLDSSAGDCPLYSPDASYDVAVEVFQGDLGALGIGPGSRIELVAGTEADRCPLAN